MFFTLEEIGQWLGVTAYEIWVWVTSLTVFTVLLSVKVDTGADISWSTVFAPLFVGEAVNAYFVTTIFIRMYLDRQARPATFRTLWSLTQLLLIFLFELLLCLKLNASTNPGDIGQTDYEFSEVMAPLFILSQLYMIRACQLH